MYGGEGGKVKEGKCRPEFNYDRLDSSGLWQIQPSPAEIDASPETLYVNFLVISRPAFGFEANTEHVAQILV